MKRLMVCVYLIAHDMFKMRTLAYFISIAYVAVLNLMIIYGLGLLMEGWLPTSIVHLLFTFPYSLITILAALGLHVWLAPSPNSLAKEKKKNGNPGFVILYSTICALVFCYIRFGDKIF